MKQDSPTKLLSESACEAIKQAIIRCELPPGSEWTEQQLRARFELTLASSRAALTKLSQERLLLALPRRGYQVPAVTLRDVGEVFELRSAIETGLARLAVNQVTNEQLLLLEGLIRRARSSDITSRAAFFEANREWHISFAAASGNQRGVHLLNQLFDESERIMYMGFTTTRSSRKYVDTHDEMLQLLKSGQSSKLEELISRHIEGTRQLVIKGIHASEKVLDMNLGAERR